MARSKLTGAIIPLGVVGGAGFLAWRSGLLDQVRAGLEAGPSAIVNGGAAVAAALPPVLVSSQDSPTASSGGGLFAPPAATNTLAPKAATSIPQPSLADRLRAIGRGDLAAAVSGAVMPGGAGTASILQARTDIAKSGTNTAARTLPNPTNLGKLAGEGVFFGAKGQGGSSPVTASTRSVVIAQGDTLGAIAARFGTTVAKLASLNGISNPNLIRTGATLRVA